MIDWTSQESHLILNPRHPLANDVRLCDLPQLSGHLWLATSGTTDIFSRTLKLVALSKEAFLASAHGVNQHLQCHSGDIWLKVLPEFHVGGLSIYSRALLAKSQVIDVKERWDPLQFLKIAEESRATLASLVPAQVYDLVQLGHKAPDSFRAVVVGGDALSPALYEKGIQLGWPLIPTYGCTECCSQIATLTLGARHPAVETDARSLAPGGHFGLKVLPHWEGATDKDGALQFRGPALLTGYAFWKNGGEVTWSDPKQEGWWTSDDFGEIRDGKLIFHGRRQELFKIGGEKVYLPPLQILLDQIIRETGFTGQALLRGVAHPRLGHQIILYAAPETANATLLRERFNAQVLPFEQIRETLLLSEIPLQKQKLMC